MAILTFRGDAQGRAQVTKLVPANIEIGDIFTCTINRKDVAVTAVATSTITSSSSQADLVDYVCGLIGAAIDASSVAEFDEIAAVSYYYEDTANPLLRTAVKLTGQEDGKPFTLTTGTTDAGGGAVTVTVLVEGVAPKNEIQRVRLGGTPTGGTFTLTFAGQTTAAIAYNANAAAVVAALEALSNIGVGDVAVTESATSDWLVTFQATYAETDVPIMTGNGSSLTGGGGVSVTTTQQGGGVNEIQEVALNTTGDSTPILLNFNGVNVPTFYYGSTAAQAKTALEGCATIGAGNVNVTRSVSSSTIVTFRIEFAGSLGGANQPTLTWQTPPGLPAFASITTITEGTTRNEKQQVALTGGPTGGTFTLTFEGQTTAGIAYNAATAAVVSALEALSNIGVGDVAVTGGPLPNTPVTVEFQAALANTDRQQMTGSGAALTGGSVNVSVSQEAVAGVNEQQQISIASGTTGGTFTLTYSGQTTAAIAYNATAGTVDTELEALSNIGVGDVTVTGGPGPGTAWIVTFTAALAKTNVVSITGNGDNLVSAGSQTLTASPVTVPTGPNYWDDAENWSGGVLPANGDIVYLRNLDTDILYGLETLVAITLAELHIDLSMTGDVGLPDKDETGQYFQYRPKYLKQPATLIFIGEGEGPGNNLTRIDTATGQTTILQYASGSPSDASLPCVQFIGTHAANIARIFKGSFGAALGGAETAVLATLQVGYQTDRDSDAEVAIGQGCNLDVVDISGGDIDIDLSTNVAGAITMTGGELRIVGDNGADSLRLSGEAYCYYNTTGALGGATIVSDQATLDFSQDMRAKTVTNPIEVYGPDAKVIDPHKVVAGLILDYNVTDVEVNGSALGNNVRVTRSVPT